MALASCQTNLMAQISQILTLNVQPPPLPRQPMSFFVMTSSLVASLCIAILTHHQVQPATVARGSVRGQRGTESDLALIQTLFPHLAAAGRQEAASASTSRISVSGFRDSCMISARGRTSAVATRLRRKVRVPRPRGTEDMLTACTAVWYCHSRCAIVRAHGGASHRHRSAIVTICSSLATSILKVSSDEPHLNIEVLELDRGTRTSLPRDQLFRGLH